MSLVQWFVLQPSTPTKQTVTLQPYTAKLLALMYFISFHYQVWQPFRLPYSTNTDWGNFYSANIYQ